MDEHRPHRIIRITEENESVRTFEFEAEEPCGAPGNYVALWLRGVSENPFSLAGRNKIIVKKVGGEDSFTSHMFSMDENDEVLIRGPYGNSFLDFHEKGKPMYVIAGGIGIAPLCYLLDEAGDDDTEVWMGFKTEKEVFLPEAVMIFDPTITTDDGTYGEKGFVTDLFDKRNIPAGSQFYICGPERMMKTAAENAMKYTNPENIIFAVERYMKCLGQGSCGHCEIKGRERTYSTCMDGPVFTYDQLMDGDFGKYTKGRSGKKMLI